MKKKLLFVTTSLEKGGAEVALVNLLKKLDKDKYEIDLLLLNHNFESKTSIIAEIPSWVNLCKTNPHKKEFKKEVISFFQQIKYKRDDINKFTYIALNFVEDKVYDVAFSYGEWFIPEFVAKYVVSKKKAVWIHNDLSEDEYFDKDAFFFFDSLIDNYIFVSNNSLLNSIKAFPFLKGKACVIHNLVNDDLILKMAEEKIEDFPVNYPVVLTVANVRKEKNHLRQVEVFKNLKDKGLMFKWINIGKIADEMLYEEIKRKIIEYKIEDDFIFLGPKSNPYPYIKKCDVFAILSDYESWSLVITEAKILCKPIISTETSGGVEQITDGINGVLVDFNIDSIVEKMEFMLTNSDFRQQMSEKLKGFSSQTTAIQEFEDFIVKITKSDINNFEKNKKKTLFIFDSVNYIGGANAAMFQVVKYLKSQNENIEIFSNDIPNCRVLNMLPNIKFKSWGDVKEDKIFNTKIYRIIASKNFSWEDKLLKIKMSLTSKLKSSYYSFDKYVKPYLSNFFNDYNTVCIISEASSFRELVANTQKPQKIQWIHTDYELWRNFNSWTLEITKNDGELYKKFNNIIFVSESSRNGFIKRYPHLENKTRVIYNLIQVENIREKAENYTIRRPYIITVGRLEREKAFDRIIKVARKLIDDDIYFTWFIIGEGSEYYKIKQMIEDNELGNYIFLLGKKENPFPIVKKADIFALLSYYEGSPNTIIEALTLGIPVIATEVGGIPEHIIHGVTGWLVKNNENSVYEGLKELIQNHQLREKIAENLKCYFYDNNKIKNNIKLLFINE